MPRHANFEVEVVYTLRTTLNNVSAFDAEAAKKKAETIVKSWKTKPGAVAVVRVTEQAGRVRA